MKPVLILGEPPGRFGTALLLLDTVDTPLLLPGLRRLRLSANLTQVELAEAAGLDVSGVSRVENCEREVKLSTARRILDALHALLGGEKQEIARELCRPDD